MVQDLFTSAESMVVDWIGLVRSCGQRLFTDGRGRCDQWAGSSRDPMRSFDISQKEMHTNHAPICQDVL